MFYFRLTFVPSFFPPSFVKFDYFLFRLLKFERTFHYSFLNIKTKKRTKKFFARKEHHAKLWTHSLQLLYQLSSSITNTIQLQVFVSKKRLALPKEETIPNRLSPIVKAASFPKISPPRKKVQHSARS